MAFLIESFISPTNMEARERVRPEHVAYLTGEAHRLLAAGAKLADDGGMGPGSFYLVDVETRAEAEAFLAADPYAKAGLIERSTMTRVRVGFYDFARVTAAPHRS